MPHDFDRDNFDKRIASEEALTTDLPSTAVLDIVARLNNIESVLGIISPDEE